MNTDTTTTAKYVYSGECRQGTLGQKTPLLNIDGEFLSVGDIVVISTIDDHGVCSNNGLSVVVSDRFATYTDGTSQSHKEKEGPVEFFVMGLKSIDFSKKIRDKWIATRVKSFADCIDGEHWKDYGFNYRAT